MIYLYEETGAKVNERLCRQYIQHKIISKDFAIYYDLYNKYRSDYHVLDILAGKYDDMVKDRALSAKFDERLTLVELLIDTALSSVKDVLRTEKFIASLLEVLKEVKEACGNEEEQRNAIEIVKGTLDIRKKQLEKEISKVF